MAERRGETIGVGVIGLGFMGGTHIRAYHAAAKAGYPCRLVAVCDTSPPALTGEAPRQGNLSASREESLFDPEEVRTCHRVNDLFDDPAVQLVSICTYTDSHVELAIDALRAGKHVLVEKPVALRVSEVRRLAEVAKESDRVCMPAMCMRFWPGWDWLRERIHDQSLGAVRSATFQRLGSQPGWAVEFYGNPARSGGALFDLHIHDVDFIHWCFGAPDSVSSTGTLRHLTTQYRFADGPDQVIAEAAWDLAPSAGFRMRYLVNFERATADFDLARTPGLVLHSNTGSSAVGLPATTGYDGEIRHVLDVISGKSPNLTVTLDEAEAVMLTIEAERSSIDAARSK